MVEKAADAQSKNQISVEGVLDGAHGYGTRLEIGGHEQQCPDEAEADGDGVSEYAVNVGENDSIEEEQVKAAGNEPVETVRKKSAEYDLLYQGGEQWIKHQNGQPEQWMLPGHGKKHLRIENSNEYRH